MAASSMPHQQEHSQLTLIANKLSPGLLQFHPRASNEMYSELRRNECRLMLRHVAEKLQGEGLFQQLLLFSSHGNSSGAWTVVLIKVLKWKEEVSCEWCVESHSPRDLQDPLP